MQIVIDVRTVARWAEDDTIKILYKHDKGTEAIEISASFDGLTEEQVIQMAIPIIERLYREMRK